MKPVVLEQLLYMLIPPLLLLVSGAVALRRSPSGALRSAVLHFAAGVVFSVTAVEIIPDLLREHQPLETVIGFGLGVLAMLGLRSLTHQDEELIAADSGISGALPDRPKARKLPLTMLVGVGVDLVVDGLLIGIGFAAGAKEGRLLALALTAELVSLGLAVGSSLNGKAVAFGKSIGVLAVLSVAFIVGAALGTTLLSHVSDHVLAFVLSFGAAALLFLVTEELLTEAHEEKETPAMTAMFFGGFLLFLILGMVT
jgi:ZIP family zinc transporter